MQRRYDGFPLSELKAGCLKQETTRRAGGHNLLNDGDLALKNKILHRCVLQDDVKW